MRDSPADLSPDEFRVAGKALVDRIADFLATIRDQPVAPDTTPAAVRARVGADAPVPRVGAPAGEVLERAADILLSGSTLNGHPRFFGYITSSAAPIGALADMLPRPSTRTAARGVVASGDGDRASNGALDRRVDRVSRRCGRLAGQRRQRREHGVPHRRRSRQGAGWDVRARGVADARRIEFTHRRGSHLAAEGGGHLRPGTDRRSDSIDDSTGAWTSALREQIADDRAKVATGGRRRDRRLRRHGAIDALARAFGDLPGRVLWFHVDGAYGAPAAMLRDAPAELRALVS